MKISESSLKNFKNLFLDKIYIFLIFVIFFVVFGYMSWTKIINFNITYYDTGYYLNLLRNPELLSESIINNHLSFIIFPIGLIFELFNIDSLLEILLFQIFVGLLPIFFFKKNYFIIFAYLLCPIVWFNLLPNFHIDILALPIIWLLIKYNDEKNYVNFFLVSIILINIKFFFYSIILGFFLYNLFSNNNYKNKIYIFVSIIHLIYFLILFFWYFGLDRIIVEIYNTSIKTNDSINIFKISFDYIAFLVVIFGYFIFFPLFKNKYILIILPTIIIYLTSPNNSNLHKFYYHYTLPIIPVLFYSFKSSYEKNELFKIKLSKIQFIQNNLKFIFLFNFVLFNLFFSPSPLSILFWNKINNFYYKSNYVINEKNKKTHKEVNNLLYSFNDRMNVVIENNLLFESIFQHNIKVFPENIFLSKNGKKSSADILILRKKDPHFIFDEKCKTQKLVCMDDNFYKKYSENLKKFEDYNLILSDVNVEIFKKR